MHIFQDPEFGDKMVTLLAALVLVLQIAMAAQRWLVTNIRIFGLQSFLLAMIAGTIALFNGGRHSSPRFDLDGRRFWCRFCWSGLDRLDIRRDSPISTCPSRNDLGGLTLLTSYDFLPSGTGPGPAAMGTARWRSRFRSSDCHDDQPAQSVDPGFSAPVSGTGCYGHFSDL
jgi:hypothetical protein